MALIDTLNGIGNAIREKTGGTELIPLKEMADVILSISGGESVGYSSITYNEDGTVTLTQTNGAIRTMTCEYDGNKLVGLKYGNEVIPLTYEDDVLVGISGIEVDMSKAPVTSGTDTRLKELVEGTLIELVDDTITTVGAYAFYNSTVHKIDLPNCETVAKNGFLSASRLTSLNLPNCTSVGDSGISSCSSLTSLVLPNCESVGESVFSGCSKLETLKLSKVKSIGNRAFYNCSALTTLIISTNQVATIGSTYPFTNSAIQKGKGFIYVPDDLVESYKTANVWNDRADQIKGLSELEVVSDE